MRYLVSFLVVMLSLVCRMPCYAADYDRAADMITVSVPEGVADIIVPPDGKYVVSIGVPENNGVFGGNISIVKVISAATGDLLWSKKINVFKERIVKACDKGLIYLKKNKTYLLDYLTGKELGEYKIISVYSDIDKDILIGYPGFGKGKLKAFRISTGEKLWEKKVKGTEFLTPWEVYESPGKDKIIFSSDDRVGIVGLADGEYKSYPLKHRIFDKKKNAAGIGAGVAVALLTGGFYYAPNYFSELRSGLERDSAGNFYVADREMLRCFDPEMNKNWEYMFPNKSGSISEITVRGDSVLVLNEGVGISCNKKEKVGKPFFAVVGKVAGDSIFQELLPKTWDKDVYGKTLQFITKPLFIRDAGKGQYCKFETDGKVYPVLSNEKDIYIIDSGMNIIRKISPEEYAIGIERCGKGWLVRKDTESGGYFLIDFDGKVAGEWDLKAFDVKTAGERIFLATENAVLIDELR